MTVDQNTPDVPRRRFLRAAALSLLAAPTLTACSSVGLFNAVVPSDGGAMKVASDISFGPQPRQMLDVYAPEGAQALPSVLFIYGGSWNSGSKDEYAFVARSIAARGYVVVVADYRLVPGVRYPDFLIDGALAIRWMKDNIGRYGGDPRRVSVAGHSAGAYNAVMIALNSKILAAAGLGRGAIKAAIGIAGPYDFLPLDDPATIAAFQSWPNPIETQPIHYPSRTAPPMLLLHGLDDTTVYPRNTRSLAAKLSSAGAFVEAKYYPGIGHAGIVTAFAPPFRSNAPVLDDIDRFLKAHG